MIVWEKDAKTERPAPVKNEQRRYKWKFFRPKLIQGKCTKCMACFVFCPEACIAAAKTGFPSFDIEHCTGCLVCLRECPEAAIEEERT